MNTEPRQKMNGKPVFTVPAKTVINFDSGFKEKLLCDGPTFSAGSACPYSCSFCYVPAQMLKQTPWLEAHGVSGTHADIVIRRDNAVEIALQQLLKHPVAERAKHKVIYASPLTDVAANMELVRETLEICKVVLEQTHWDIRLLSKSNLLPKIADGDWGSSAMRGEATKRIIYGVSTGTLDDKIAAAFEDGTPLVSKRIASLRWLQDNGFRTFGMLCPSLPDDGGGYMQFAANCETALRYDRCEHVWAEIINLRGESFTRTDKALRDAGYGELADVTALVSRDKKAWEQYARATFLAHTKFAPPAKLRFLQYVTKDTEAWWRNQEANGAVIL